MRELTSREQRTVRFGAAALALYLVVFAGVQGWKSFSKKSAEYRRLVLEAQGLKRELRPYEDKVLRVKKLMETLRVDPARISRTTLVAQASAAIQRAALSGGVQVGAVREEYVRGGAGRELATIKLEGQGAVPALMGFLHRLETLGYPLVVDSVQIGSEAARAPTPGALGGPGVPAGPGGPGGPGAPGMPGPGMPPPGAMVVTGGTPPMGGMPGMGPPGVLKLKLSILVLDFERWKEEGVPHA